MTVSVVIPTFNRRPLLLRTLDTLRAQQGIGEILVVDDGSSDGTAEAVRALTFPWPLRVLSQPNRGPAAARNTGWRAARGELIVFLDDDMLCAPGLVAAHAAAHADGIAAVAMGAIRLSQDSPRTLAALCFEREFAPHAHAWRPASSGDWLDVPIVFSNTSLPRSLLEAGGGFDETFRMREDLELGYRLLLAGAIPCATPEAIAYQQYTKTARQLLRDAEIFAEGDFLFAQKHPANRVRGQLNWMKAAGPHAALEFAEAMEWIADPLLAAACALGETIPVLRGIGVRALAARRRLRWHRQVLRRTGRARSVHALVALKLAHTFVWAFFAAALLALPVLAAFGRFTPAAWLAALILGECAVLALNHGRCPISKSADRLTGDRAPNYDIYLPEWLARWNKHIFGLLFVLGLLTLAAEWYRSTTISR